MTRDPQTLLGLPVESRMRTAAWSLAVFVFYAGTMSRGVSLYDSPELAMVAEQLGLGHPLGQPLHTLLGALVSRLPGVDALIALNGLSAMAGALTVVPATSLAESLLFANEDGRQNARWIAPTVALLATLPVLWEPATRVEVYPLAVFFSIWAGARLCGLITDAKSRPTSHAAVGFALGLAASANPMCAVGMALGLAPSLAIAVARRTVWPRHLLASVAGGIAGLLPYAYVFWAAPREDVVVWGAPVDAASIRHYFSAADFVPKQVDSWGLWAEHLLDLGRWSLGNGMLAVGVAGVAGMVAFRRPGYFGLFAVGVTTSFFAAFVSHNGVFAPEVLDYLGYLAIPMWIAGAGAGLLVVRLAARRASFGVAALVTVFALVTTTPPGLLSRTRHLDHYTEALSYEALRAAPPGAIVFLEHDHWVGSVWYLQEQLGIRPDVVMVAYGLSASSWYWKHVYRQHPTLVPFALRGPGGRPARVRRFLDANSERPVQIERTALADTLGLGTCVAPWWLDVTPACGADDATTGRLSALNHRTLTTLGHGSPGTDDLIALVAFDRGYDLWRHGYPRAAVEALLAGVPRDEDVDFESLDLSTIPPRLEPQAGPAPTYAGATALGHPAQNLHFAALIAAATTALELASYFGELSDAYGPVAPNFTGLPGTPANL
ncbi:MAG: DUF2723 domain-containing protein [Polyangiales bacterium]